MKKKITRQKSTKVTIGITGSLNIYIYSRCTIRRRHWQPTPVLLPGKSHGQRSLVGYGPWGCKELDTTERLHFYFSLLSTGEGNSNPLQYSCLENPRDGGAWWAAVYGVAQSQTRLTRLSSSSRFMIKRIPDRGSKTSTLILLFQCDPGQIT